MAAFVSGTGVISGHLLDMLDNSWFELSFIFCVLATSLYRAIDVCEDVKVELSVSSH